MESSTNQVFDQPVPVVAKRNHPLLEEPWERVIQRLPGDLAQSAKAYKAMLRCRKIPSAEALLHLAFLYTLPDRSYRQTAMLATLVDICNISDVNLMHRLQGMPAWLGALVVQMLQQQGIVCPSPAPVRLKILDATVISQPKSQGTDWRLHVSLDLGQLRIDQVLVTNEHGGEGFGNFSLSPQDICLADSGYARTRGLAHVLQAGAKFVTREQWNTMPVFTQEGEQFDIIAWLKDTFPQGGTTPAQTQVWLSTAQGLQPVRLVACPLPPEKAEAARQRARKKSLKKKHHPMEKNLYAVGFVILLTNLSAPHWPTEQVLALYRWRWQIELYFKRLKSLLELDHLRSQNAELVQTYLLTKLLAAMLVDRLRTEIAQQVPDLFDRQDAPISIWRLDAYLIQTLIAWVTGHLPSWQQLLEKLSLLERYLCGSPRKRRQQLALARAQLAALCAGSWTTIS
jgi:hypothetical protein